MQPVSGRRFGVYNQDINVMYSRLHRLSYCADVIRPDVIKIRAWINLFERHINRR